MECKRKNTLVEDDLSVWRVQAMTVLSTNKINDKFHYVKLLRNVMLTLAAPAFLWDANEEAKIYI